MNCSNCGKQIAEGASFCSFCGARTQAGKQAAVKTVIDPESALRASEHTEEKSAPNYLYLGDIEAKVAADEAQQYATEAQSDVSAEDFAPLSMPQKSRKNGKRKLIVILSAILAAVMLLSACAAALMLVLGGSEGKVSVNAYISNSGDAYICYGKGRYVKITNNVKNAHLTPDRKRAVVIGENGDVYMSETKNGSKRTIYSFGDTADVSALCVTDAMVLLISTNKDGATTLWRYTYDEFSFIKVAELSKCDSLAVSNSAATADDDISVIYSEKANVYILEEDEPSATKVFTNTRGDTLKVHSISPDGEAAVWSTELGVYLYSDGKADMLSGADASQSYSLFTVPTSDMLVVAASDGKVYIKQEDGKLATATLPGALSLNHVILDGESLVSLKTSSGRIDGVLVSVADGADANLFSLFLVRPDGSYRRIRENISTAVYGNDKTVYYISNGDLYSYDVKKNTPTKIESKVASINTSDDGDSVYYVHHVSKNNVYGTLSVYTKKDGKQSIATNVLVGSLTSNLTAQKIDPNSMWFEVYQSPTAESYTYNAVFYNGKQTRAVIKNIER